MNDEPLRLPWTPMGREQVKERARRLVKEEREVLDRLASSGDPGDECDCDDCSGE